MKKTILTALLIITLNPVPAQQGEIDSLQMLLKNHLKHDTTRIDLLNQISYSLRSVNPQEGLKFSEEAIAISKKLNDAKRLALSLKNKGTNLFMSSAEAEALDSYKKSLEIFEKLKIAGEAGTVMHNMAIVYFGMRKDSAGFDNALKSLKIFEQLNDTLSAAKAYRTLGLKYSGMAEYEKSIEYFKKAFEKFGLLEDDKNQATVLNSIGVNYLYLSDFPRSLENYLKAISIFEKLGDNKNLAMALTNAGIIYEKLGKYEKALEFHHKALHIMEKNSLKENLANSLASIANVYSAMDDRENALKYVERALKVNRESGNEEGIANNLVNIGIIYYDQGKYDRAFQHINEGISIYKETGNRVGMASALSTKANILRQAPAEVLKKYNINPGKRYDEAIMLHEEAISIAGEIEAMEKESEAWKDLSKTFEAKKDFKGALTAFRNHVSLHDSILNDSRTEEITRKEMQFEFEKKEAIAKAEQQSKEAIAHAEIEKQKLRNNTLMGGAALLVLAGGGAFASYKRRRDALEQKDKAMLQAEVADTEMKALRAQMNPHFIFNSLNSITYFLKKSDNKTAENFLVKFAKLMRMILENSEKKEVTIAEDLGALELYMQLESLRMNNKFSYEIKINPEIQTDTFLIPPLILQPFIENSIWHGISGKKGEGKISIQILRENEMIKCIIEDDGVGRKKSSEHKTESPAPEKKSLGMKITKSRIDIINKTKNTSADVRLIDLEQGLRVEVTLPLEMAA